MDGGHRHAEGLKEAIQPSNLMREVGSEAVPIVLSPPGHCHFVSWKDKPIEAVGGELAESYLVDYPEFVQHSVKRLPWPTITDVVQPWLEPKTATPERVGIASELLARLKEQNLAAGARCGQGGAEATDSTPHHDHVKVVDHP
jgi:hypothetical protein